MSIIYQPNELWTSDKNCVATWWFNQNFGNGTSTANLIIYYPLYLSESFTFNKFLAFNTSTAPSGNFDFGVYNAETFSKVFSIGSTAAAGSASTLQEYSITEQTLAAGGYYMAVVRDTGTAGAFAVIDADSATWLPAGVAYQTGTYPLPSTMVPNRAFGTVPIYRIGIRRSGASI